MRKRSEAPFSLDVLFHKYGIPRVMVPDNAGELTQGDFAQKLKRAGCIIEPIEAYTPNQNKAESAIRELKRAYRRHISLHWMPLGLLGLLFSTCDKHKELHCYPISLQLGGRSSPMPFNRGYP